MDAFRLRDAAIDDATFFADVHTAVAPHRPVDPVIQRYWWDNIGDNFQVRRFVIEEGGDAIGVASFEHPRWEAAPERFGFVDGELLPAHRSAASIAAVFAEIERRLVADGARRVAASASEDDPTRVEAILARDFHEDRRGRRWELDLVANGDRIAAMAEEGRVRMRALGIQLLTLAEDPDPEKYRKIWRLSWEATQDEPTTLPHVEETLEDYMRWTRSPEIREDRFWIARAGDDLLGISVLDYPPVRGIVGTAWTATARSARGRGIARALKCETLVQAIALGVDRVRTGNDAKNDPILHINASMGYRPIAGRINFLKDV